MEKEPILGRNPKGMRFVRSGKVRDIYDLGDSLLMIATDRISAFDEVMQEKIPDKGKILHLISVYWFEFFSSLVGNHIITTNVDEFPEVCQPFAEILRDRSMIVKKADPLDIEAIVRGYISGSGWKSYGKDQTVCGIGLPIGLIESEKLPEDIFTPSTKATEGHDINIPFEKAVEIVGQKTAEKVRDLSLEIYQKGVKKAAEAGIIIADTKFEFGIYKNKIILIDELLTPDSSRFWPQVTYKPGGPQESFDKQILRDYLEKTLGWDKNPPAPNLPSEIITRIRERYIEALIAITGNDHGLK